MGKQERNGPYGSFFFKSGKRSMVIAARPMKRLWKADMNGAVKTTLKFEESVKKELVIPFITADTEGFYYLLFI